MEKDFKSLGQRIGALYVQLNNPQWDIHKAAAESVNVESGDDQDRQTSTSFMRLFCKVAADRIRREEGLTPEGVMLEKLANTEVWCSELQDIVEDYMGNLADAEDAEANAAYDSFSKEAKGRLMGLIPGAAAGLATTVTPNLIKALLATGIGVGAAGGGLSWGLQRAINEDDEAELDTMKAKINEYQRINALLSQDPSADTEQEQEIKERIESY
jgi:hypothetical protein